MDVKGCNCQNSEPRKLPPVKPLDYARISITETEGLLFVGRIRDFPGPTLTFCKPGGQPLFDVPRDKVQRLTPAEFARMLADEARYQAESPRRN